MTVPFATPDHVQGILAKREEKQQQRRREKNPADSGRRRRQHRGEEHEDEQEHTQTAEDEDFASYVASKAQKTALEAANSRLLVKKGTVWYGMLEEFFGPDGNAGLDSEGGPALVKPQDVERLKKEGTAKLAEQVLLHEKEQGLARSDAAWTRTILRDGTASDRCSALVLAAQASPVHGLAHIQALLAMAQGRSRHDALLALDALRELFNSKKDAVDEIPLLPPHRKLLYLHQQPRLAQALALDDRQRPLAAMLWVFEETLKTVYLSTIRVLEVLSQDAIAHGRSRATRLLFDLLTANPHEQPANILALLANKLGDPERRLASRIPYYLTELVNAHPEQLTEAALLHVRTVLDRPGISEKARYYALCFLVQIRLARTAPAITASLLQVYLSLFTVYVVNNLQAAKSTSAKLAKRAKRLRHKRRRAGETGPDEAAVLAVPAEHARMAKMLLTGINRALPFAVAAATAPKTAANGVSGDASKPVPEDLRMLLLGFTEPLLRLCKPAVSLSTTLQALQLLLQLAPAAPPSLTGQAIRALEAVLEEQNRLRTASASHPLFLRVIHQAANALAAAGDDTRLAHLLKALLRFSFAIIGPAFVVGALAVTSDALAKRPLLRASLINQAPESLDSARDGALFELVVLTRHYHPRVARLATAMLRNNGLLPPLLPASADAAVHAAPFEHLSFATFLAAWSRMDRRSELRSSGRLSGIVVADAEEFAFIHSFADSKDAIAAAKLDKSQRIQHKKQRSNGEEAGEQDDLEADADELMEREIERVVGNEDDDLDFSGLSDDNEDDEDEEDFEFDVGSDEEDDEEEDGDEDSANDSISDIDGNVFMDADAYNLDD